MKKKVKRKSRLLISGYLERISRQVFSDFPKQLTDLIGKQHGVYALYKGNRLYYVGLATNLRSRIGHHLRDRHAEKWDKFSLYLIRKADHIKELESLILRIADPVGNRARGRLAKAKSLKKELQENIKAAQVNQLWDLLGSKKISKRKQAAKKKAENTTLKRQPTMKPYIRNAFKIQSVYKGKKYEARVRKDGTIYFNGKLFNSPSMAGKAVKGRATDGWLFWKYKDKDGSWVRLDKLRK